MEIGSDNDIDILWNALAHSKRRQIVNLLSEGPLTTSEICDHFDVSRFAVMKHLTVLEEAGLVRVEREGRVRWNILNQARLQMAHLEPDGKGEPSAKGSVESSDLTRNSRPTSSTVDHYRLEQAWQFSAPLDRVFEALTQGVNEWWSRRMWADSRGLVLETWLDGRFFERVDDGDRGYLLGRVSVIKPDAMLCLSGPLAMPGEPIHCHVCLSLENAGESTQLRMVHSWAASAAGKLVNEYEAIWQELLGHLKTYVEEGITWRGEVAASTHERT